MNNFDPKITGFAFGNALGLVEAAALAYENKDVVEAKVKGEWGFDECVFIDKNETQLYIAKSQEMILIAFRGTETDKKLDILTDLFAWRKKTELGNVHAGFYIALDFVFTTIVGTLKRMRDNQQSVWITGHSLGGALATLCAVRLAYEGEGEHISGVYTYGQPLVGDIRFKMNVSKFFFGKFYRLVNFRDPVTLVPLKCLRYHHVGEMVLFNDEGVRVKKATVGVQFLLVIIPLVLAGVAVLKKNTDLCKEQLAALTAPHALVKYKENITKNLTA
ncbi:MAG: lipase family protein [Candidatus Omnitrophica bacterium]|nr:lipase family protein [Candidatus Omnitrophota bacterium]